MNPYLIIGLLIAVAMACAGSAYEGHHFGVDQQAMVDQKQFDTINAEITRQKAEANALYKTKADEALAVMAERDKFKTQLETQHVQAQKATDDLRTQLAGERLRFAAQGSGSGASGSGSAGASANPAGNNGPATCVLSAETSESLKQIVYDADRLRDDYTLLYNWAHADQ